VPPSRSLPVVKRCVPGVALAAAPNMVTTTAPPTTHRVIFTRSSSQHST
jgi:hypothetical protein